MLVLAHGVDCHFLIPSCCGPRSIERVESPGVKHRGTTYLTIDIMTRWRAKNNINYRAYSDVGVVIYSLLIHTTLLDADFRAQSRESLVIKYPVSWNPMPFHNFDVTNRLSSAT